ncbi:MAG: hypothetical protein ABH851_02015 [Methanobacteriota archaeon]
MHKKINPRLPSKGDLEHLGDAGMEDLVEWTAGFQQEIARVVALDSPPAERGAKIKELAGPFKDVQCEVVWRYLTLGEGQTPGETYSYGPVLGQTTDEVLVQSGERTLEDQAKLHGGAMANLMINAAISGQGDLEEFVQPFL